MTGQTGNSTMRALVKKSPGVGNVGIEEVPIPDCPPDGVRIEVAFTGICGTDIHVYHDRFPNYPPVILGHEFSGVVRETGPRVGRVKPGDRVTVLPSSAVVCGACEHCRQGYYMFCPVRRGMGHGVNGSLARYAVVREDMVYPLPDAVSLEAGALAEPLAAAVQPAEELTTFHVGDTVLVTGPGPIGLLCLALLVRRGCRVIIAGARADALRLELARRLGAALTLDASGGSLKEAVDRETDGRGADAVIEASGAEAAIAEGLRCLRKRGKFVQVGICGRDITLPYDQLLYKQVQLFGSVGHSLATWDRVMRILAAGLIDLRPLISHVLPLSRWREAFDLCENKQGVKVLVYYDRD